VCFAVQTSPAADLAVLKAGDFAHYIEKFNAMEDENVTNTIPNAQSWDWLQKEIPFFACPDQEVEEMYYFRWWSFRKHLVETKKGWVITEFLTPVGHAGEFNTISCAAGFHLAEGRWLRDQKYLDDYTRFWFRGNNGQPPPLSHRFSSWLAAAAYDRYRVNGDGRFLKDLLPDFVADYQAWEKERQTPGGLFWQYDVRDGMEESISGSRREIRLRPTINSYMFANARAIAATARLAGDAKTAAEFESKAVQLKRLVQARLWNDADSFYEVCHEDGAFAGVREELGYIPWMFELPERNGEHGAAWAQLLDERGFLAPAGITTAERRSPLFRSHGVGHCEWDGAVWPFATCQTLYGLANFIRAGKQTVVTRADYFNAFLAYTRSQHQGGKPFIGEYLDEVTGDWINGKNGRSRYYNHSTYADLLITGVIGLRPRADAVLQIWPLLPAGTWNWFCLDGVKYHGRTLTILWDADGTRYGRGPGLLVLADGKEVARGANLAKVTEKFP
jgi:hypothetical protein